MKAILEFNLPEDKEDFNGAVKAFDFWNVLWEYSEFLRGILKHDAGGYDIETVEKLQKHLFNALEDHSINLEEYS